jgi:hypothetical protein
MAENYDNSYCEFVAPPFFPCSKKKAAQAFTFLTLYVTIPLVVWCLSIWTTGTNYVAAASLFSACSSRCRPFGHIGGRTWAGPIMRSTVMGPRLKRQPRANAWPSDACCYWQAPASDQVRLLWPFFGYLALRERALMNCWFNWYPSSSSSLTLELALGEI